MSGKKIVNQKGYTLIELLIVLAIVALLIAIALPQYRYAQQKAREAVLLENLTRTREILDQYFSDKGKYPESIDALVQEGYLRKKPFDPITGRDDTWEIIYEDMGDNPNPDPNYQRGVYDIKSGAQGVTLDGRAYSEL